MNNTEQLLKVRSIIEDTPTCMLVTSSPKGITSRPMHVARHDDNNNLWFLTDEGSSKVSEIFHDNKVLLTFSDPNDSRYLSLNGRARIIYDQAKKNELFNVFAKVWFPEGPTSDKLSLIKIDPDNAEYWDNSSSKLIQLFKIGKAILTKEKYTASKETHGTVAM